MSRVSRFAARDPGPVARLSAFMDHLRHHGYQLGVAETALATSALLCLPRAEPEQVRAALRAVCAGTPDQAAGFDRLFDAFWMDAGRVREKAVDQPRQRQNTRSSRTDQDGPQAGSAGRTHTPDGEDGTDAEQDGEGRLQASHAANLMKRDLRDLVDADDIRRAETIARQLGEALRDRRSRRRKAALSGRFPDFRRTIRRALQTGGIPIRLALRTRPDRPVRIVALADVSGSMLVYARPFLSFLAGLLRADDSSDAYLFHTRLVRVTEALRDEDPMRAINRTTLLADGIGGGSKIGAALARFSGSYARRFVNGRSVVIIFSDGYDTDPPEAIAKALADLRKRGCRIVWLNPLKGWREYQPVARGMAAALPYLDLFAAANRLEDLAALDKQLEAL